MTTIRSIFIMPSFCVFWFFSICKQLKQLHKVTKVEKTVKAILPIASSKGTYNIINLILYVS